MPFNSGLLIFLYKANFFIYIFILWLRISLRWSETLAFFNMRLVRRLQGKPKIICNDFSLVFMIKLRIQSFVHRVPKFQFLLCLWIDLAGFLQTAQACYNDNGQDYLLKFFHLPFSLVRALFGMYFHKEQTTIQRLAESQPYHVVKKRQTSFNFADN